MNLTFRNRKLQKICSFEKDMPREYGKQRAQKLKQRLMELAAAENLDQIAKVPPPRCHEMTGNRKGQLSVDLGHPYRLYFIPAHDPVPTLETGGLDWKQVTAVEILEIADPH